MVTFWTRYLVLQVSIQPIQFVDFSTLEILVAKLEVKETMKIEVRFAHQVRTQINLTLSEFTRIERSMSIPTWIGSVIQTQEATKHQSFSKYLSLDCILVA